MYELKYVHARIYACILCTYVFRLANYYLPIIIQFSLFNNYKIAIVYEYNFYFESL